MREFIYALTLVSSFLVPTMMSLLGGNEVYEDGQHSPALIAFKMLTGALTIVLVLMNIRRNYKRVYTLFYWLPVVLIIVYLLEYMFIPVEAHKLALKGFLIFLVYSVPNILLGVDVAHGDELQKMFKYVYYLVLFMSIAIAVSIPSSLATGSVVLGGTHYQAISYISAFCYGVVLYVLLFKPVYIHRLFLGKIFSIISMVFLILLTVNIFISGGRGGVLLLIANTLVLFFLYFKQKKMLLKGVLLFVGILASFIVLLFFVISNNDELSTIFEYGFNRAFSYISDSGGIDMDGVSNRDIHYGWAFDHISESPLYGYGFFRSYGLFFYPHNIFLEVMLDGGVPFLSFVILLMIYTFNKLVRILKQSFSYACIIPCFIYPVVHLFVSATYKHHSIFWFCLSFIMSFILFQNSKIKNEDRNVSLWDSSRNH